MEQAFHALSMTLYEKTGAQAGAGGAAPGPQPGHTTPPSGGDDDTIDAEFEVKS